MHACVIIGCTHVQYTCVTHTSAIHMRDIQVCFCVLHHVCFYVLHHACGYIMYAHHTPCKSSSSTSENLVNTALHVLFACTRLCSNAPMPMVLCRGKCLCVGGGVCVQGRVTGCVCRTSVYVGVVCVSQECVCVYGYGYG